MSYQVIALKYRPQRFSDVVGQDHVIRTLSNAIDQNRIAHAYLFSGPRGTGKTTIARIFAKALNCTDGPKANFPDDDPRCKEITDGRSLDVLEIDGASNRGIEEIRELRETVKYSPASSRYKIYIIDEVHMLTKEAFNALLKTLEEPPAHAKFMFATTEPEKVLPTILSRCQRFDLRRIPSALIVDHLASIAKKEGVSIDEFALYAIARGADGGMRDAESTLDQLISFCGDTIEESNVLSMFGLAAHGQIMGIAESILSSDANGTLNFLNELAKSGKDLTRLLGDLLNHFRNLLIYSVSNGDVSLLEISESEAASLKKQADGVDANGLTRILEVLTDSEYRIRNAASKKIALEVALLKAIEARNSVHIDQVLKQLQSLKAGTPDPAANAPAAPRTRTETQPPRRAPEPEALRETPPSKAAAPPSGKPAPVSDLKTLWQSVVESVGKASKFAKVYLLEAHPVSFENGNLTVGVDPSISEKFDLIDSEKNRGFITDALTALGHTDVRIKIIKSPAPPDWQAPQAAKEPAPEPTSEPAKSPEKKTQSREKPAEKVEPITMDPEEFKNDPLIKKALEVFKGQIVKVTPPAPSE